MDSLTVLVKDLANYWYGRIWVMSYKLLVMSWKLKSRSWNSKVQVSSSNPQILIPNLQVQIHKFKNHLINENSSKQP